MRETSRPGPRCFVLASAVLILLAGCVAEPTPQAPPPTTELPAEPGASPTPWDPGDVPDASDAVELLPAQRGDCAVDPSLGGTVALVVVSDDDETPVEVTYDVFRTDGTIAVRRMTQPGPILMAVQQDCTDGVVSSPWQFRATRPGGGALSCWMTYGGRQVTADSAFAEGADEELAVDCTGHPGM
ncbi:hypothetical protein [Agromyces sp. LHK192]|uniref:hypothetical protein n=1 Tax=Agromyces sp. LHK192 TaxID=2498704 RepID=UPI000FDC6E81|nr:hypothetical protein [Agromyces sp. LHK192]